MKNLAVGIDFSDAKTPVIEAAIELAKPLGATLHLIHIISPVPSFVGYAEYAYPGIDEREAELEAEKKKVQGAVDDLHARGIDAHGYMKEMETVAGLIEFAKHHDADLLIVGSHSRNFLSRVLLGSTAEGVIRKSEIPVLVVPVREKGSNK
jgi:nucleotide-binding universal stress UspA family protein